MTWKIPLADVDIGAEEEAAVLAVLRRGWLTMGSETKAFEKAFAEFTGAKYAVAVTNCTAALHLACITLGLGPGDEVIVPSLSFVATANAVRYTGATPVFADIESEEDLCISASDIAAKVSEQTRAIIVMHYGGYACDMPQIMALARQHDIHVIEDAAHAPGAELDGRALGTWSAIGCFSFFSNKNMTTGEGGMLVTDDDTLAHKLSTLRSHGMTTVTWDRHRGHAWSYDVVAEGYNYRIDELRAALGRVQLAKLPENNLRRQKLNTLYLELLEELAPDVLLPFTSHPGQPAYHIRPILLPASTNRLKFMDAMKRAGIQTSIHYPPIHQFSNFRNNQNINNLALTELVASREVTLPLYPQMTADNVKTVALATAEAIREL